MHATPAPAGTDALEPAAPSLDSVLQLVLRQAALAPEALALRAGARSWTYGQLTTAAGELAAELRARGCRPGDAIGLLLARSAWTVVAQLAVWWAGCHYVPVDPDQPRARTTSVLADAQTVLTIGDQQALASAGLLERSVAVEGDGPDATHDPDTVAHKAPAPPEDPDALACVMYTSGSHGRPKGVMVPHRAIAGLVAAPEYATVEPYDRVLFHSAATFDAATFEVWAPLARGAAVVVASEHRPSLEDLARDVERHGATVAFFTTGLFHQLAARGSRVFDILRTVVVGGDVLSPRHGESVLRQAPWLALVHAYGPTETTTFATAHRITPADFGGPVPIGLPVNGATAQVMDEQGRPVVPGERGELWVGGPRLAHGYLGQPDLTAEQFVVHPLHGRMYRTGDVVSAGPDGTLNFHGRLDDQVKVRGFRVEPREVEKHLYEHPAVGTAAVVVRRDRDGEPRLMAYVTAVEGARTVAVAELRAYLEERLPAYMQPVAWGTLDELPLNNTGKVDRQALATASVQTESGRAPRPDSADVDEEGLRARAATAGRSTTDPALTPVQSVVARLWSSTLGVDVTSPDDNFHACGGHSLLAMGIVDNLREELDVEIGLADFFRHPTVAGQAALVERALRQADEGCGNPASTGGPR